MPEIEIPEDAKDRQERQVGLTIAILAILLAVVSALGNEQDNEKIVKQIEASNGFAWYQSKRIRQRLCMRECLHQALPSWCTARA